MRWPFSIGMDAGAGARREDLEHQVERLLTENGWQNRCAAIAIEPELENWVGICLENPAAQATISWPHCGKDLKDHFREQRSLQPGIRKLNKPKETFEQALQPARVPRSAGLYCELATRAPIAECVDTAFLKLRPLWSAGSLLVPAKLITSVNKITRVQVSI
jgi:hypothetical protein